MILGGAMKGSYWGAMEPEYPDRPPGETTRYFDYSFSDEVKLALDAMFKSS